MKLSELIASSFYEVHKAIKEHRFTHYWLAGGRGSTKSSFASIEIVLNIMKDKEANAVVLRKIGNTLEGSVYNQIIWAILKLKVMPFFDIKKSPMEITYKPYGNKILFRGSDDPLKLKSIKFINGYAKYIWYEEITEFFGMEEIRNINQSLLRGGDKFTVLYSYNPPRSLNNWVNVEELNKREDKLFHRSTYLDVPKEWLGEQFIIEAEELKRTNELAYKNEYLGIPTGEGGAVFSNVKLREIPNEELNTFDKISSGIDFGYAVDPAIFTQNHYDKTRKRLFIFNEIWGINMPNKKLSEEIQNKKVGNNYITCDSAEPKSIAELISYGLRCIGAKKGPDSVEYGIKWLQSLNEIIIDPKRCPNTAREFSTYEYARDKYGNFISKFPDQDNHSIDATRYSREQDMRANTWEFSQRSVL